MIFFNTTVGRASILSKAGFAAFAVAASLAGASTALSQGTGYSDNFNSYLPGYSLSGQGGWDTNDPDKTPTTGGYTGEYVGQSDYVGSISGYSAPASDYWAYLGGGEHGTTSGTVLPGVPTSYLYHPLSVVGASNYAFNVDMSIATSTAFPTRDSFAWTFLSSANGTTIGSNLFSLNFSPDTNGTAMNISYSVNGGVAVPTTDALVYNSIYHLTISVNVVARTATVSFTPTGGSAFVIASNIPLTAINPGAVQEIAATWRLANGTTVDANGGYTGAGGNELLFNNYVVSVPEPSTWAMMGVGVLGAALLVRRRVRA